MNIDKIVKECPKAWEECMRFFIHPHNYEALEFKYIWNEGRIEIWEADGNYLDLETHFRELYDYFDSVGVGITVYRNNIITIWDYRVGIRAKGSWCKCRTEAEYKAFEKAFEIREQQLNEVTNESD